ncbi:hypothetical protein VDGD_21546 [Verticillium dahliae]|nr:hypothetical protein VDGD_21546 [Verticillium dahliae]
MHSHPNTRLLVVKAAACSYSTSEANASFNSIFFGRSSNKSRASLKRR